MIWFTSDFHLDDKRMISQRKIFTSLEDMEKTLIRNFNSKVRRDDTVWLMGDMVGDEEDALRIIPQLNGKKKYLVGNHDRWWIYSPKVKPLFEGIYELTVEEIDDIPVTLCHYPLYEWYKSKYGGILIHGHMHDEIIDLPFYTEHNAYDVSVEKNDYYPVSWFDIVDSFKKQGKSLYVRKRS